jgi:murein DD-endopeptidase
MHEIFIEDIQPKLISSLSAEGSLLMKTREGNLLSGYSDKIKSMDVKSSHIAIFFLFLLTLSSLCGCGAKRLPCAQSLSPHELILCTARSQLGKPYRPGGVSPETGFDCSGFTGWVYRQHQIDLPRRAIDQLKAGQKVLNGNLREGDLVFFDADKKEVSHVGIYLGDDSFIHSSSSGGHVREDRLSEKYWKECYRGACRLLP